MTTNLKISFGLAIIILSPKVGSIDLSIINLIILFFYIKPKIILFKNDTIANLFFLIVLNIIIITLISNIYNNNFNFELIAKPIRILIFTFCLYMIAIKINNIDIAFTAIGIAGVINSSVVITQFFAINYLGFSDDLLRLYPAGLTESSTRVVGLAPGFPAAGMLNAIASLYFLNKIYYTDEKRLYILAVICFMGVLFTARTSLVLFIVFYFFLLIKSFNNIKFLFINLLLVILFSLCIIALLSYDEIAYTIIYIMFEPAFNYLNEDRIGVNSTDDLIENNYFLPSTLSEWIIGNSESPWTPTGIPSDVWFVQVLIGSGIFITALYLVLYFMIFFISIKHSKMSFFVGIVFIIIFISSFKAAFIFQDLLET